MNTEGERNHLFDICSSVFIIFKMCFIRHGKILSKIFTALKIGPDFQALAEHIVL